MRVTYTAEALADLRRLREFIAASNPRAAQRVSATLVSSINHLGDHPKMGLEIDPRGIRRWVSGNYVVRYRIGEFRVIILTIRHGREAPL